MPAPSLCVVWWARLGMLRPDHLDLLDQGERDRLREYRHDADRERFGLGALVLRLGVARATGERPERVRVDRSCPDCARPHGRPQVLGGSVLGGSGLATHVSVSHSGELVAVAVAVSAGSPIGIDVEQITAVETAALAGAVFGPAEEPATGRDFFVVWTRKESAVKATGDGLRVALPEVLVSPAYEEARVVGYPGRPGLATSMVDLRPRGGRSDHVAALTVLSLERPVVQERDADELLDAVIR